MFGLSRGVTAGLVTGFMSASSQNRHMKAEAKAAAAAAAKEAENAHNLELLKQRENNARNFKDNVTRIRTAEYTADKQAETAFNRLGFDMLQKIPEMSDKGIFSLEPKDHYEKGKDGTIIPTTPFFRLYFNKKFPKKSLEFFTHALNMQKNRKQEVNKWSTYPTSLQEYFLLKDKKGGAKSYYEHLERKTKANTKLTTLELNYKAYVEDVKKFNEKELDRTKKQPILPFEYWFALNAKTTSDKTVKNRAKAMLKDYNDGSLPPSLIYLNPEVKDKKDLVVHPALIRTLAINDLLNYDKKDFTIASIIDQSKRHAKHFYNKQRQASLQNTKLTGRMHITSVSGLGGLKNVLPDIPTSETVLQETYGNKGDLTFNSASDMLSKLMKLGLFGTKDEKDSARIKRIKESNSYGYILSLLNAMSKGVKSEIDNQETTTYFNLQENIGKTLQILTKIDKNLPETHSHFFNQKSEVHHTDKVNPENGTVITKISRGKLGSNAVKKLNIALHLEKNNPIFKELSSDLKTVDSVGLTKKDLLKGYQYYFPTDQKPRVISDVKDPYVQSQKLILENPFLAIISPYLSGYGNFTEYRSEMSTVQKRLKSIKYPRGTSEGRKISFWDKRNKLEESQSSILQLIDTSLTYAGDMNNTDIRDMPLNNLITRLNQEDWKITTGIGSDVFQSLSDIMRGLSGVGQTYGEEIISLRQQFSSIFLNNAKSIDNMARTHVEFNNEGQLIEEARDKELSNATSQKEKDDADRRFSLRSIILFNKVQLTYKLAGLVQGDQTGGRTISNQDFDTVWKHLWGKSDLSNLANLKALRKDIDLRMKLGEAFDIIYEFEGQVGGTLKRAAAEVHHDQTKRWIKAHPEYAYQINDAQNNSDESAVLRLNGLVGLENDKRLTPIEIRDNKIVNVNFENIVPLIRKRTRYGVSPDLNVPHRFVQSALYLSTVKDNPNSPLNNRKAMLAAAYSLAITTGLIYGTKEFEIDEIGKHLIPLDSDFYLNDTDKKTEKRIFNPRKSAFFERVLSGDKNAFDELLRHMEDINFSNYHNNDSDYEESIGSTNTTLETEKRFLINLLKLTQRHFNTGD